MEYIEIHNIDIGKLTNYIYYQYNDQRLYMLKANLQVAMIKVKEITDVFYLLYTYSINNNIYSKQYIAYLINGVIII